MTAELQDLQPLIDQHPWRREARQQELVGLAGQILDRAPALGQPRRAAPPSSASDWAKLSVLESAVRVKIFWTLSTGGKSCWEGRMDSVCPSMRKPGGFRQNGMMGSMRRWRLGWMSCVFGIGVAACCSVETRRGC